MPVAPGAPRVATSTPSSPPHEGLSVTTYHQQDEPNRGDGPERRHSSFRGVRREHQLEQGDVIAETLLQGPSGQSPWLAATSTPSPTSVAAAIRSSSRPRRPLSTQYHT